MQEIWKTYKVPMTISGVGLCLALILGFAPLMGQSSEASEQKAAMTQTVELGETLKESQAATSAEIAELRQIIDAQTQTIRDFENRLANLDRGVTRTFWRVKENTDVIDTLSGAGQRLSSLETQIDTLNTAVPRISARIKALKDGLD